MHKFTVEGKITLRDGDSLKVYTENKLEIYILFADGTFSVSNESNFDAPSSVVLVQKDGKLVFYQNENDLQTN